MVLDFDWCDKITRSNESLYWKLSQCSNRNVEVIRTIAKQGKYKINIILKKIYQKIIKILMNVLTLVNIVIKYMFYSAYSFLY
jgi:hypothetical protein